MAYQHLTDYLKRNAQRMPDKPAIIDGSVTLTWAELWEAVENGASCLAPGLARSKQEIVALLMPNTWEYVVAYLSIVHAGHIAMPIDVIYKPLEINAILKQIPPKLIIADEANRARLQDLNASIIGFEELKKENMLSKKQFLRLKPHDQIASLLFTSGTTGRPKAVPHTHTNHIWNIDVCSQVWGWNSDDTLLISLRLSHVYGLVMVFAGVLYHGNTMYLQARFSPRKTLEILSSGKISMFNQVSMAYSKMLAVKGDYDLSKVRLCISGGAPLPPSVWKEFKKRFKQEILEVYGTTETGRIASNLLSERIPGSPGRPLPTVRVKLGPDNEVMIKSPGVFPGYFHNLTATKKGLIDGWWKTGDIGAIENGRIVLKGRVQERIVKYGYTISPRDIEWALHNNPEIQEVYVMGQQKADSESDLLIYYLVSSSTKKEILNYCKLNLPSVWRPDKIIFLDNLPRTRSGKPDLTKMAQIV